MKMFNKDETKIKNYSDFVQQLIKIKESETAMTLGFYKYCHKYDKQIPFSSFEDFINTELENYGLKPVKITKNLDIILKFKDKAEAIIYIKPMEVDICILKL